MNQFKKSLPCHMMFFVLSILKLTVSQSNNNIQFDLLEEQKADTYVGDVAQASGIRSHVAPADVQKLGFEIFDTDSTKITSLFTINHRTGALYTNAMIDREQVCESGVEICRLEFDVTVKLDPAFLKILHVIILIKDINDNTPTFLSKDLRLSISEASPKGSDYSMSGAMDRDARQNTFITYWLEENSFFGLREEKLLGVSLLKVVLLQDLDRETQSEHYLHIFAKDGNTSSALTGTMSVTITVTDVNDNSPQFEKPAFNFTVSEDADVGSAVGTIDASDLDAGENGRISFLFSSHTSNKVRQLFDLNVDTGTITVKSKLEYESGQIFQAVVVATDHGQSPKASQAILVITVLDSGNTPPKVSFILAGPMHQTSIVLSENSPADSFVGRLKYQDNDEGEDGVVDCMSLNPNFALVSLEDRSLAIETKSLLDRETQSEMTVILRCSDRGTPSLSNFINFTVLVADINDNSPVFARSDYTANVRENQLAQEKIVQVSATDRDQGTNAEVTYHLTMNSSNSFTVDPFTGWISVTTAVDRETQAVYRLTLEAVDKGSPSLTGSVTVTIHVEDDNDNPPQIIKTEYQIRENQEPDTFVAQIAATDIDDGANAKLVFELTSDSTTSFKVSSSGVITTAKVFDRETLDHYTIVVSVTDGGSPSLTTTSTLTITISDSNDHSPEIVYPRSGNDSLTVSANISPGTVIAATYATDADVNRNAQLLYLIAEGNPRQIFSIDNSTGTIFLSKRLTTSRDVNYRLTISVQDCGNPRLQNSTFLYIKVDFTNSTLVDSAADVGQKYVIIAGVLSGTTLIIAVIVVAIILTLRNTEPAHSAESAPKVKDISLVTAETKDTSLVNVHQMSTVKISSANKQAGVRDSKADDRSLTSTFCSNLTGGNLPLSHRLTFNQKFREQQRSPQFPEFPESRQLPASEDLHSNTSQETTTSDSGRGGSDVDEVSSGASVNSAASPDKFLASRIASHHPALIPSSSTSELPSPGFARGSVSLEDFSGTSRIYQSQTESEKMRRTVGKVRFSFDDQNIQNPRPPRSQLSHDVPTTNRQQRLSRTVRAHQSVPWQGRIKLLQDNCSSLPPSQSASQAPHRTLLHVQQNSHDPSDHFSSVSSFLLSKDALAKHNRLQSGSKQQNQQLYNKHSLLHPHHNQQNGPLVSLNSSADDDDDDVSTTTSGSYAVEAVDDLGINSADD